MTPSSPSSPHWYDRAAFAALVHSHIREIARTGHPDVPLGEFIREFDGLSGSAKQKAIRSRRPGCHPPVPAGRARRRDRRAARRDARNTPNPPRRTGSARSGATTTVGCSTAHTGCGGSGTRPPPSPSAGCRGSSRSPSPTPSSRAAPGSPCNHAPAFGDPLGRTLLSASSVSACGAASFLATADADTSSSGNRAAVVHVICAGTTIRRQGQGRARRPVNRRRKRRRKRWRGHHDTAAGSRAAAQGRPQSRTGPAACPR